MAGVPADQDTGEPVQFYRAILEHSHDVVAVADADGRLAYGSPAVRQLTGYDPEELEGTDVFDLVHPEDRSQIRARFAAVVEGDEPVARMSSRIRHRDGGWRFVEGIVTNLLDEPAVEGMLVTVRDVTSLRRAEAELERTRALLRQVVDHVPVVLWKVDAEGVFQLSVGRGLEAMGLAPGEVVGQNIFELYANGPDQGESMRRALSGEYVETSVRVGHRIYRSHIRPVWEGEDVVGAVGVALDITELAEEAERADFRARLLDQVGQAVIATDPDGTVIYWNLAAEAMYGWTREEALGGSVTELTVPAPEHDSAGEIINSLHRGERWAGEYEVQRKDGTVFPALVTNVPILEDDELVAIIGVSVDLTEQKELEDELRQAQKMEAVGQLAGGIAHDFNNLLTTIGGYATLAAEHTDDPQVSSDLKEIEEATRRARGLADKLLAFSRRGSARPEAVDLNATVRGMVAMLTRLLGEDIDLDLELADEPWRVDADPSLTEQAILNVVLNSRDAMPTGGTVTLSSHRVALGPARVREIDADLAPGEYMRLVVEDTGTGIEPDVQARIFDPFFTTKEVGQGSGLGLSMVYGAVKQVGGGVTVESEPGAGTRVALFLPRAEADDQTSLDLQEPDVVPEHARVLVVEDEPAVLSLASRVLDREGYDVAIARSGEEARRMIEDGEVRPDVVISDVIMPDMSGPQLIQWMRLHRPGIRSLFMSGYAADELESEGLDKDTEAFLAKPFTPEELINAVHAVLTP